MRKKRKPGIPDLNPHTHKHLNILITVVTIAVVISALAGLSGCSQDSRLTLRISTWASPEEMEIMDRCLELFEERFPEVRVIHETYPSGYLDKLLTSMAAGSPPDVILLDSIHIPSFVESDQLVDLAPYVDRVNLDLDKFYPKVLEIARVGEQLFAFPKDFTPLVYYYNKNLFDKTATPYPSNNWTWADFLDTCKRLTFDSDGDGRPDHFGTDLNRELFRWQPWVWNGGGDILSPDGTKAVGFFDSPETVRAFRFLTDLARKHRVTKRYESLKGMSRLSDEGQKMFYSGRVGLFPSGHWWIPKIRKYMGRENIPIGVAPFPRFDSESEPVTVMYESGWAVPVATRHRKWAIRLAAFLADDECQAIRAEMGLAIPAMSAIAEEMAANDPTGLEATFLEQVQFCRAPWGTKISRFSKIEDIAPLIMDRVIINGEPVERAAAAVARLIEEVLPDE